MTYYYNISDPNAYTPKTEAQRNYLARKTAKTEAVKRAIRLTPELREIIYKLDVKTYKDFIKMGNLEDKKIPYSDSNFNDSEISRKDLNKYINLIARR